MNNLHTLNDQHTATILAGLRLLQAQQEGHSDTTLRYVTDFYITGEGHEPLDSEQIDELIGFLNTDQGGEDVQA